MRGFRSFKLKNYMHRERPAELSVSRGTDRKDVQFKGRVSMETSELVTEVVFWLTLLLTILLSF